MNSHSFVYFVINSELKYLGIKDYQVAVLAKDIDKNFDRDKILGFVDLSYQILHLLFVLLLSAVPFLFLNLPVGVLAGLYSERRRKRALAKSKVKIRAFDVSVFVFLATGNLCKQILTLASLSLRLC